MSHYGIKNISGEKTSQKFGGLQYDFDKDEVKIVTADAAQFFQSPGCEHLVSKDNRLMRKRRFSAVPLHEALKVAKEPENPEIAKAKAQLALEEKHKGEIRAEIIKELKEGGWRQPVAASK